MNEYFYTLPKELIAQKPAEPRDSSRLFIYDTRRNLIHFDIFKHCAQYIPQESILVLNKTKVVPARVMLKKETSGRVEVLFLINEYSGSGAIPGIVDRKVSVGQTLFFENGKGFFVERQEDQFFFFKPLFPEEEIFAYLERFGLTPIPPYIEHHEMTESILRARYQSVFAKTPASIAAPTASLHFTDSVMESCREKNIAMTDITLHVGMGTFAPVTERQIETKQLHTEWYSIPQETIELISNMQDHQIIPVGTTAMRAIESYARNGISSGKTNLFIKKPYEFRIASGLITNFHVSESSLMYLVDAFLEYKHSPRTILELYDIAIQNQFRFYSFGDAMLII